MTPNPFDQAALYLAKLDPSGFLLWLLGVAANSVRFRGWLDTRTIPFPGEPDRICDTVAGLVDENDPSVFWAMPIEFQWRPLADMFGRLLEYLARLWRELRPPNAPTGRCRLVAAVVNLTETGNTSRDMALGQTGLRTCLRIAEKNVADEYAEATLEAIANGRVARCLLPWIPLMRAGGESSIIDRWKELALAEPDQCRRTDYGGLALVLAELAGCLPQWKQALEDWNMEQSVQVSEWQAIAEKRGEARGKAEGKAESLLQLLKLRFPLAVSPELTAQIRATSDLEKLDRWFAAAVQAPTLAAFQKSLST